MPILETLDDLGIRCIITPMSLLTRLHLLNTFDDIGITLVCRPLRYLHRFAAFLLDSELYPIITYSDVAGLKADESIVSSITRCSTSLRSAGGSGASVTRVSEKGRIRKSKSRTSRGGSGRASATASGTRGSSSLRSVETITSSKKKRRSNGQV